jgi:hypothetical protein
MSKQTTSYDWNILVENPNIDYDFSKISNRPDLDWDFVKKNPILNWDMNILSNRHDLDWEFVKNNPTLRWNLNLLVKRNDFDWNLLTLNPFLKWDFNILSKKKNLDWKFVADNINLGWNLFTLANREDFEWSLLHVINDNLQIFGNESKYQFCYVLVENPTFKLEYYLEYKILQLKSISKLISQNARSRFNKNSPYTSEMLLEFVRENPVFNWDWVYLTNDENFGYDMWNLMAKHTDINKLIEEMDESDIPVFAGRINKQFLIEHIDDYDWRIIR